MLVFGVLLFLTQWTSRREGNRQVTEPKSWTALQAAFPQLDSVPHMDTVANVLEKIPPGAVEAVLTDIIKDLLHHRRNVPFWGLAYDSSALCLGTHKDPGPGPWHGLRRLPWAATTQAWNFAGVRFSSDRDDVLDGICVTAILPARRRSRMVSDANLPQ